MLYNNSKVQYKKCVKWNKIKYKLHLFKLSQPWYIKITPSIIGLMWQLKIWLMVYLTRHTAILLSHCINHITENVILIFHDYKICNKMNSNLIWFDFIHVVYATGLLYSRMITHVKSQNMQLRFFKINMLVVPNCYCYCSCINAQWDE